MRKNTCDEHFVWLHISLLGTYFFIFFYYSWALSHPVNRILKYWSRERRVYKRGIKEEGWNFVLRHLNTSVLKWSRGSKQEKKAFFESYSDLLSFKWTTVVLFTSLPPSSPSLLSAFSLCTSSTRHVKME